MRSHSRSGQPSGLMFQKRWAPSRQEIKPHRGEEAYLRFARRDETKDSALRKTARSNSGEELNAETRMGDVFELMGKIFLLTFLFIGLPGCRLLRINTPYCGANGEEWLGPSSPLLALSLVSFRDLGVDPVQDLPALEEMRHEESWIPLASY
jgi:hypothetical protein